MQLTRVEIIRDPQGGRNFIRKGDAVRVAAGRAEKSSWRARFMYAEEDPEGTVVQVTVFGGEKFDPARGTWEQGSDKAAARVRTVVPERIHRLSQAHVERRKK